MTSAAPESVPAWARGYQLENLQWIARLFAEHDEGFLLGAFGRAREADVAAWLSTGALLYDSGAAVVLRQISRPRPVRDFRGVAVATMRPGDWYLERWAGNPVNVAALVLGKLRVSPQWMRGWAEHWRTAMVAEYLHLEPVATKVLAASEVVGVYAQPGTEFLPLPPEEEAGIVPLALPWPLPDTVLREAAREAERIPALVGWAPHYSSYNAGQSWSAVALRGYSNDPTDIVKPAEMSRGWKAAHPGRLKDTVRTTELAARLPACCVLSALVPGGMQRVRLMRLRPGGGELTRHADITDREAGVADGRVARVHIPLATNPEVRFTTWGLQGKACEVHMAPGRAWYLDTRKPHRAINGGTADRVHLVLDVHSSEALRECLR